MKTKKDFYLYFAIVSCLICFSIITILVITQNTFLSNADKYYLELFTNNRTSLFNYLFVILSYLGSSKFIALFCFLLLFLPNRKKLGIPLAFATALSATINLLIKIIIARVRPDGYFLQNAPLGYTFPASYSYTSGHSQTACVFYLTFVFLINKYIKNDNYKILTVSFAIILCVLTAMGRIYLGVHFFSDVLAGLILALAIICFTILCNKQIYKRMLINKNEYHILHKN